MFRNLRIYRLKSNWPKSEQAVSDALEKAAFKPCGPLTERSSGWMAIHDEIDPPLLARRVAGVDLLRLRSQSRIVPPGAVNEALEIRIADYQARMNETPSASEKRRMKAETRDELLPQALLRSDKIWGFVDLDKKILAIDAAQPANAERFLRRLKFAYDDLEITPLQFAQPVIGFLTRVFLGNAPATFALGRECRMQDSMDNKSSVRWTQFDLSDASIRQHVAEGMRLTHLAIEYDNILSFVLSEDATLSKIKILGMDDDTDTSDDPLGRLDAEFVLATGIIRQLLNSLDKQLGGMA